MTNHEQTSDALKILHRRYYKNNPDRLAELEEAFVNDDVARKLYTSGSCLPLDLGSRAKDIDTLLDPE